MSIRDINTAKPATLRKQLRAAGYLPIPVIGKMPPLLEWQKKVDTNDGEIDIWAKTFPDARSTGLLTRTMPTLDIDIKNPEAAAAVEQLVRDRFEEHGRVLVRFGNAPKRAIPFKTDMPFAKITANLIAPDGSDGQKFELLANGQQLVGFGIHPNTEKPYAWFDGEPGQVSRDKLPMLNESEAKQLVEDAVELLVAEHGYTRAATRPKKKVGNGATADAHTDAGGGVADWSYLAENIHAGRELHDSLLSLSAKLITAGMGAGAVVNFLRGLMDASSAKDTDRQRWEERYADIPRAVDGATENGYGPQTAKATSITATSYDWKEPEKIPPRDWLYGNRLIRKFATATVAPGGIGKSSLEIAEMLAMVSGKALLGVNLAGELLRVWYWNLEDPREETERRIQATAKQHGLKPDDIGDRLFFDCGREQPLVIAETLRNGAVICHPVVDALVAQLIARKIDVLTVDPFVSSHHVVENDNNAMDMVVKEWGRVADLANCAVELVHHVRKGEQEVTAESARGGGAFIDGCRVVRVCNRMTEDEAKKAGVDNRRLYFRAYNDKANLAPPAESSNWFKLVSVDLCNSPLGPAAGGGDSIGVVVKWQWPDHTADVTGSDFDQVAMVIREGKWRADAQAKNWVGKAVAQAMELNLANTADRAKVTSLIKYWLACGSLIEVEGVDERRKPKTFIEVKEDE